jgi:hypothetical protein
MLSIYGFRNFLRGKKLFQKLKFWNSLIHPAFHWDYWTRAGYYDREFVLRRGSPGNKYDRMKIAPMIRGDINILGGDPQSMIALK